MVLTVLSADPIIKKTFFFFSKFGRTKFLIISAFGRKNRNLVGKSPAVISGSGK
jgi:hypothetical protein